MVGNGIPLGQWSGSDATAALHETIKQYNSATEIQTKEMVRLTRVIMWLTVVMLFAVLAQIGLALLGLIELQ